MISSWRTFWLSFLCSATILALLCGFALPALAEELPPDPPGEVETVAPTDPDPVPEPPPENSTPDTPGTESQPEQSEPEPPSSSAGSSSSESSSGESSAPGGGGSSDLPSEPEISSSAPEEPIPPEGENGGIVPGSRIDINDPNITVSEAIFQIRYVFLFLVFGAIPLICSCVILFVFFRWIYRIVLGSV